MRFCPNDDCPFVRAHRERSTYEDDVEACLDCGAVLERGQKAAPPLDRADQPLKLVTIATFPFDEEPAARLASERLGQSGIPAMVALNSGVGRRNKVGSIALQVNEDDAATAREVLGIRTPEELEDGAPGPEGEFVCDAHEHECDDEADDGASCGCGPHGAGARCAICGSPVVEIRSTRPGGFWKSLAGLFGAKQIDPTGETWTMVCKDCGAEWEYE